MPLRYSHNNNNNNNNKSHFLFKVHNLVLSNNFLVQCLTRKVYPSQFEAMAGHCASSQVFPRATTISKNCFSSWVFK